MKTYSRGRALALVFVVVTGLLLAGAVVATAQSTNAPAGPTSATPAPAAKTMGGLWQVIFSSGPLGVLLWIGLFADGGLGVYLAVDCALTVRAKRLMPPVLLTAVTASMAEGDVLKALKNCEDEPGPLANVLSAGFSHVEEGFEVIQDAIQVAADLETEKMMQKLTWLSVVSSIGPMLGLLGTVQGMIAAFLALTGTPDFGVLALNIGQALYTTAAGLIIAIPVIAMYHAFRNNTNTLVLRMQAMTLELIKDLRNVEVVSE